MKTSQDLLDVLKGCPPREGLWQHYKGSIYRVVGSALREDTLDPLVLYRECRDGLPSAVFARPLAEWAAPVELGGAVVPRFRPLAAGPGPAGAGR